MNLIMNGKFSIVDLQQVVVDAGKTQSQAFAAGTWDNLMIQWVKYLTFCISFGLVALPADNRTLA